MKLHQGTKRLIGSVLSMVLIMATLFTTLPIQAEETKNEEVSEKFSALYVTEDVYDAKMDETVVPFIKQFEEEGYITGEKGLSLYYRTYNLIGAKGTIVISHGLGESLERYEEMIYYFLNMGYSVYAMEHRGHCRSGRLGSDATMVGLDSFDNYYKDLKTFIDQIVVPVEGKDNLYLYAHSMGGGIGVRFLEKYPEYFKAAVLSSPMLDINSGSVPSFFAKIIAHGASITPWKNDYVAGKKPYSDAYNLEKANTRCEVRYKRSWKSKKENPMLQMGGTSYQWLSEAYFGVAAATFSGNVSKVEIPLLMLQAGQDKMVGRDGQDSFAKRAKNCQLVRYEDAKHTLFQEKDEVLKDYCEKMFTFLENN